MRRIFYHRQNFDFAAHTDNYKIFSKWACTSSVPALAYSSLMPESEDASAARILSTLKKPAPVESIKSNKRRARGPRQLSAVTMLAKRRASFALEKKYNLLFPDSFAVIETLSGGL